jgi:hypothetical protein
MDAFMLEDALKVKCLCIFQWNIGHETCKFVRSLCLEGMSSKILGKLKRRIAN